MTEKASELPFNKIAFIIDGQVVDILHTQDRLAAILLSDPTVVDITDIKNDSNSDIYPGWTYDSTTKSFTPPAVGA